MTVLLLAFFLLFFMVTDLDRAIDWMLQASWPWQRRAIKDAASDSRRTARRDAPRDGDPGGRPRRASRSGSACCSGCRTRWPSALLVLLGAFIPLVGPIATTAFFALAVLAASGGAAAIVSVVAIVVVTLTLPRILGRGPNPGYGVHPMVVLVALEHRRDRRRAARRRPRRPRGVRLSIVGPAVIAALDDAPDEPSEGIVPRWLDRLAQWSVRLLVLVGIVALLIVALRPGAGHGRPAHPRERRRGDPRARRQRPPPAGPHPDGRRARDDDRRVRRDPRHRPRLARRRSRGRWRRSSRTRAAAPARSTSSPGRRASWPSSPRPVPQLIQFTVTLLGGLAAFGIVVVVGSILTFYLLRDGAAGFELVTSRFTRWRHDELEEVARRASRVLGGYMVGTGVVSIVGAGAQFILMTILGLPLAWPLAVLSFFGGYIPYIGPFLTTSLAFLVTVAVGTPTEVAIMFAFTLVINIVQGNIVAPLVYGKAVSIHPAVVLLAIPAGSAIAGIAGMFLAVPVVGILATTWRIVLHVFARGPRVAAEIAADQA